MLWVFLSHFRNYIDTTNGGFLMESYLWLCEQVGQLCVVMFLFYSGYGVFSSIRRKPNYMQHFIRKRLLPVWFCFAICVFLFVIENLAFSIHYSFLDVFLAFTGWTSIGNDNWYMFVIFILYIFLFLCFRYIEAGNEKYGLIIFSILSFLFVAVLYIAGKESWWYNTLLCFSLGMWYAYLKDKIDKFINKSTKNYFVVLCISFCLVIVWRFLSGWHGVFFCAYSLFVAVFIVIISAKIRFRSMFLAIIGKHVFSIYILQRLVFRFFEHFELNKNIELFFILALIVTILISFIYDKLFLILINQIGRKNIKGVEDVKRN